MRASGWGEGWDVSPSRPPATSHKAVSATLPCLDTSFGDLHLGPRHQSRQTVQTLGLRAKLMGLTGGTAATQPMGKTGLLRCRMLHFVPIYQIQFQSCSYLAALQWKTALTLRHSRLAVTPLCDRPSRSRCLVGVHLIDCYATYYYKCRNYLLTGSIPGATGSEVRDGKPERKAADGDWRMRGQVARADPQLTSLPVAPFHTNKQIEFRSVFSYLDDAATPQAARLLIS